MPDATLERWRRWAYGILAVLFGYDVLFTTIAQKFGAYEVNPVMVPYATDPFVHFIVKVAAFLIIVGLVESCSLLLRKMGQYSETIQKIFLGFVVFLILYYAYGELKNIGILLRIPYFVRWGSIWEPGHLYFMVKYILKGIFHIS